MNALKAEEYKLMFSPSTKVLSEEQVSEMAGVTAPAGLWDPLGIATSVPEGQLLFFPRGRIEAWPRLHACSFGVNRGRGSCFHPCLECWHRSQVASLSPWHSYGRFDDAQSIL